MKKLNCVLLFGFLLILIAGCSKLEIQPDPLYSSDESALKGSKSSNHERPFKVNKSYGPFWIVPGGGECGDPPMAQGFISGEGNATHLGKFTVVNTYCMDLRTLISEDPKYWNWEGAMTAANGDILATDILNPVVGGDINPGADGVTYYTYTVNSERSTGRFEGATGTILMWGSATFDPNSLFTGTWEMEGEGTISY